MKRRSNIDRMWELMESMRSAKKPEQPKMRAPEPKEEPKEEPVGEEEKMEEAEAPKKSRKKVVKEKE